MPRMPQKYAPPENEADFERLCLRILRVHWKCPTLELYGRRGEKQDGVDIFDQAGSTPFRAAQCKLREPWNSLPPSEIGEEVKKARNFRPRIDIYGILTSAKVSIAAQGKVVALNKEHRKEGFFSIQLFCWDQIERLIDQYPEVREEFCSQIENHTGKAILQTVTQMRQTVEAIASSRHGDSVDAEIDEAKAYIDKKDFQRGMVILERIRNRRWDTLLPRQKWRLLSNLAVSHLGEGKNRKAGQLFVEAKPLQPDEEKACANEAFGWHLLGERQTAFEAAGKYKKRFPHSTRLAAVWVNTAPPDMELVSIERELPQSCLQDSEVLVALSTRSMANEEFEKAKKYAERAIQAKPNLPYAYALLAELLMKEFVSESLEQTGDVVGDPKGSNLSHVEEIVTKGLQEAQVERDIVLQAQVLLLRSYVRLVRQNKDGSEKDIIEAYGLAPKNREVVRDYAVMLLRKGDRNEAIRLLRELSFESDQDHLSYLLGLALSERNEPGDAHEAIKVFGRIAQSSEHLKEGFREDIIERLLNISARENSWEVAEDVIATLPENNLSQVSRNSFGAILNFRQGKRVEAVESANAALQEITSTTTRMEKRRLARGLSEIGLLNEALPLWEELADRTKDSSDTRNLLECARRLRRHELVLTTCESLRNAGVRERSLLDLEISLLEQYGIESAIKLLEEHLTGHPEDSEMRIRLSIIGLRVDRKQLVTTTPDNIPAVEEVSPQLGEAVVGVLKEAGYPNDALKYAYEFLRRNFDSAGAHRAYIHALSPLGAKPIVEAPKNIEPGTAVLFIEKGENNPKWVVIEDSPNPDKSRDEISPDSHLARQLIGKASGDEFVIATGSVSTRTGVVQEVISKYVYRHQRCMSEWQLNFPEEFGVEVVRVKSYNTEAGKEEYDLSAVRASVEQQHQQVQEIQSLYRSDPIPVHLFGKPLGINAFEATIAIASREEMFLKCCVGSSEEQEKALKSFSDCHSVVIDLTVIATLAILDGVSLIQNFPKQVILSQAGLSELQLMLRHESLVSGKSGTLGIVDGQLTRFIETKEECQKRLVRLKHFVESLVDICEVVECRALALLDPARRDNLINAFGRHGAESMVLASDPGRVLWTDDHILSQCAQGEFGVNRIWTQAVIQALVSQGIVEPEVYFEVSAKLLGCRYSFTSSNAQVLIKACELSEWKLGYSLLKNNLDTFGDEAINLKDAMILAARFIVELFKQPCLPETQQALTIQMLERLAGRKGGLSGIRVLAQALPQLFGVNKVGGKRAAEIVRYWLAAAESKRFEL